jgi:hypothetical protein
MYPTSTLCRTQEAHQRALASGTTLDNVRRIAENAAMAWANEALVAERREARHARSCEVAGLEQQADRDRFASENPDRDMAA